MGGVYEVVDQVKLAVLETKMDTLIKRLDEVTALEKRVSGLERWRAFLAGAWVVLAAVIAYLTK